MIIMALDHVRDFLNTDGAALRVNDDLALHHHSRIFLTRWITHFCAPGIPVPGGNSARFSGSSSGRTRGQLSQFLVTRGIWLIFLELTVVRDLGIYFTFDYSFVALVVIWAIGCSMIALAVLIYLPPRALLAVSIATISLHNLFDGIKPNQFGAFAWAWNILHQPGTFNVGQHTDPGVAYPLIPWIAVMSAGYCSWTSCFGSNRTGGDGF